MAELQLRRLGRADVICAALTAALFFLCADPFLGPPDCASYWAWAEAIGKQLDLDFIPCYARLEMQYFYTYLTSTGRVANDWPMGAGLVLLPTVWLGRHISHAWLVMLAIASIGYWWRMVASRVGGSDLKRAVQLGLLSAVAGTPLLFYALFGPFFSHLPSFAITTAFLVLWDRTRQSGDVARRSRNNAECVLLGLLLGAATLVRPQNLLLALVFLAELQPLWQQRRTRMGRTLVQASLFLAALLLALLPRFAASAVLYGSPLALPKLDEMHWLDPQLGKLMLSDFHGVLPWTPIYLPTFIGLLLLYRSDRGLATGLLLVLVSQVYVNAANLVWWSGGSFGNRRLADSAIIVAYGIIALYSHGKSRTWRGGVAAVVILCCSWSLLLVLAERRSLLPLDRYIPFDRASFWSNLALVLTEPFQTLRGLVRFPEFNSVLMLRAAGALMIAGAVVAVIYWRRSVSSRAIIAGAISVALALSVITTIAAVRTPRVIDSEYLQKLPAQPGVLWDNFIELAYYNIERERPAEAIVAAERAIALRPTQYSGWWYLGQAHAAQGNRPAAAEAFREVLRLHPNHPTAWRALAAVSAR